MGTIQRKLNAVREHWFQILIACGALALAFGLGMSFQADFVEDAAEESQIRSALLTFSRQMETFANDVDRMTRQAEQAEANREPADDPMENWVISSGLAPGTSRCLCGHPRSAPVPSLSERQDLCE